MNLRLFFLKEHRSAEDRLGQDMLELFLFPGFILSSYFLLSVGQVKNKTVCLYMSHLHNLHSSGYA